MRLKHLSNFVAFITAFLAICILIWLFLVPETLPRLFSFIDLLQYWAAAKLFVSGQNPYDPKLLFQLQSQAMDGLSSPILMWNPPLILPLIAVLAALDFSLVKILFFVISLGLIVAAFLVLLRCYGVKEKRSHIIALLFLLTFYPFMLCLFYGQISQLLLIGLAGFLFFVLPEQRDLKYSAYLGGVCLSLTLIKPHLLYLLFLYLLFSALKERKFYILTGLLSGGLFLLLLACAWEARVLEWYLESIKVPPIYWQTPTLGSHLQGLLSIQNLSIHLSIRLLPTILGLLAGSWYFAQKKSFEHLDILSLIPLSLLSSPYGWVYDQILLLPVAVYCISTATSAGMAKTRRCLIFGLIFGANILMMAIPGNLGQQVFVWYPLCFSAALYCCKGAKTQQERST